MVVGGVGVEPSLDRTSGHLQCLSASGGPYLFGKSFTIADAMYGPVVSRFRTYSIPVSGAAKTYMDTVWSWPAVQEWVAAARAETLVAKDHED